MPSVPVEAMIQQVRETGGWLLLLPGGHHLASPPSSEGIEAEDVCPFPGAAMGRENSAGHDFLCHRRGLHSLAFLETCYWTGEQINSRTRDGSFILVSSSNYTYFLTQPFNKV